MNEIKYIEFADDGSWRFVVGVCKVGDLRVQHK